jgi:hypothetical protein
MAGNSAFLETNDAGAVARRYGSRERIAGVTDTPTVGLPAVAVLSDGQCSCTIPSGTLSLIDRQTSVTASE